MRSTYKRAFALSDNPFGPRKKLPGVLNSAVSAELETNPLRVHEEPSLLNLFAPNAGKFKEHIDDFLYSIEEEGYDRDAKTLGLGSSVVLICGHHGTGKTTLTNVLIHYLKECDSRDNSWKIFEATAVIDGDSHKRLEEIENLKEKITQETQEGDHCCVVIDDIVSDEVGQCLAIYDFLKSKKRFVFLFLVTSDPELIDRKWGNSKHSVTAYKIFPLKPSDGAVFVEHRVNRFRGNGIFHSDFQLFPFDKDEILNALETALVENEDSVTIRQLNYTLFIALRDRLKGISSKFDVHDIPKEQISEHLINLLDEYARRLQ